MSDIPTFGKITPRQYQWDAHLAAVDHVREQIGKFKEHGKQPDAAVSVQYVGAGKTIGIGAMANHCSRRNIKCLILARQGELIEQNSDECWNMDAPTSVFSASLGKKSTHYPVVAGTEGTVARALDTDFANWLPLVILIDENHMLHWEDHLTDGSTQYSKILRHFDGLADRLGQVRPIVIGFTGSPYRGTESIIGPYWKKQLADVGREYLVDNGFLVPTIFGFGHDDVQYDLAEFDAKNETGTGDFTDAEMAAMYEKMDLTTTQKIMREVVELTAERNGVLITCANKKHCIEAANGLPKGSWGVVTDDTPTKERSDILRKAKTGELKFVLQVGCLTTGVNVPLWDVSVILRRIGSLTLLVQLLGRGMRLLKDEHTDAGFEKSDHLVLDYAGTMAGMIELYNDPLLEEAELSRAKNERQIIHCPRCGAENSEFAQRCIGHDNGSADGRCEHFFRSKVCEDETQPSGYVTVGCGAENSLTAHECRCCGREFRNPNDKLTHKAYSDDDWRPVERMELKQVGTDGVQVIYHLGSYNPDGTKEVAVVNYWAISAGGKRAWERGFIKRHVNGYAWQRKALSMPVGQIVKMAAMFDRPKAITHRIGEDKQGNPKSIVHGLQFGSREFKGSKKTA